MKVYDCFIFSDEFDLLNLRFHFLNDVVDHFVLVESKRTLSGLEKPLHFANNKNLFEPFLNKTIYLEAPVNELPTWEYEYFQRNYIKTALANCMPDDIVHISDADEIPNIKSLMPFIKDLPEPVIVKVPMYYYWFNFQTNSDWYYNLIGRWKELKHVNIGNRYGHNLNYFKKISLSNGIITGWHFSYLFGTNVQKYQRKIKSFSHQDYNTPYYMNEKRILKCVILGIDLFERNIMKLRISNTGLEPILPLIKKLKLDHYFYTPSLLNYINPSNLLFLGKIALQKLIYRITTTVDRLSMQLGKHK